MLGTRAAFAAPAKNITCLAGATRARSTTRMQGAARIVSAHAKLLPNMEEYGITIKSNTGTKHKF